MGTRRFLRHRKANSETDNGPALTVKNLRQTETPEATVMISSVLMPVTW